MKKLKVKSIDKFLYKLVDSNNRNYEICFEFIGFDFKLNENDYIYIPTELLNPRYAGYSSFYTFGKLVDPSGKKDILANDIDVIKVVTNDKKIYLKRLYG